MAFKSRDGLMVDTILRLFTRAAVFALFFGLSMGFSTPEAKAEFNFCNKTSYVLKSALAYRDGGWVTKGWHTVLPGKCVQVLDGRLREDEYYTFAQSQQGHKGGIKYFAGDEPFCVSSKDSFTLSEREDCAEKGLIQGQFVRVDVDGEKSWTTTFTEPKKFTPKKAEIAGTQRLLADIGFDPGRIDGEMGKKTLRAISSFKKAHDLKSSGLISDELLKTLAIVANQEAEDRGYKFCNRTESSVWAAIGFQAKSTWTSRGWWKIDPGNCAKVLKDTLTEKSYYVYAVAESDTGEEVLVGGRTELCTAEVKFDIEGRSNCELRGYAPVGFQKVETKGAKSWTQEFVAE